MSNLTNEINPWEAYKKAIQSKFPSILNQLNAPATDEQITELEAKIGLLLPEQFKQLYKINNGEKQEKLCGILLGFHLYSLEDILREWTAWKEVREELSEADLNDMSECATSAPLNYIQKRYSIPQWIPLCGDSGGNHIGLDLAPDSWGTPGQIITFGRDEDDKIVVAKDLYSFVKRLHRITNSDHFAITKEEDEYVISLNDYNHLIDYLKSEDCIKENPFLEGFGGII